MHHYLLGHWKCWQIKGCSLLHFQSCCEWQSFTLGEGREQEVLEIGYLRHPSQSPCLKDTDWLNTRNSKRTHARFSSKYTKRTHLSVWSKCWAHTLLCIGQRIVHFYPYLIILINFKFVFVIVLDLRVTWILISVLYVSNRLHIYTYIYIGEIDRML